MGVAGDSAGGVGSRAEPTSDGLFLAPLLWSNVCFYRSMFVSIGLRREYLEPKRRLLQSLLESIDVNYSS